MLKPFAALLACAALAGFAVPAQAWEPKKPIQIIVGFAAGGGTDIIARQIAASAQPFFPVPLVIVNKPGAAGTLAAQQVARETPDGHTLLVAGGSESTAVPAYRDTQYDPRKDFRPIIRLTENPQILVVGANSPIKSVAELLDKAKASPGQVSFGSSGVGSLVHATSDVFARRAGVKLKHIPYQGGGPAVQALVAGQIDFLFSASDEIQGQLEGNAVRPIGIASAKRDPQFPDLPTLKELGYDFAAANMKGLVAPPGLPDDVYQYLHDNFRKGMQAQIWQDFATKGKFSDGYLNGPDFQNQITTLLNEITAAVKG